MAKNIFHKKNLTLSVFFTLRDNNHIRILLYICISTYVFTNYLTFEQKVSK